jgi:hypothetical protein
MGRLVGDVVVWAAYLFDELRGEKRRGEEDRI